MLKKSNLLYVENLSPDIALHIESIAGILSNNGGILSHMAIIAREQGMPVMSHVAKQEVVDLRGKIITIDTQKISFYKS